MNSVITSLGRIGIIPVVVLDSEADAAPVAQALLEGGLPTMEITFRTAAARAAIECIARSFPSILTGAGTVLTVEQAKAALDSGATYIVSPGLNRKVIEYCLRREAAVIPGVVTPTEVGAAMEFGLEVVKLFPAEAIGGIAYLKALSAPFRNVKFIPTGGISETNANDYLGLPCVAACGGSWMVKRELIANKRFDEIRNLASRAARLVRDVRGDH